MCNFCRKEKQTGSLTFYQRVFRFCSGKCLTDWLKYYHYNDEW